MTDQPDTVRSGDAAASGKAEAYCPACGHSFPPDHQRCPNDGGRLVQLAGQVDPLIGRVFEQRYEIRSRLGEGGMGAVYRGWQVSVDREVAIKVIDPRLSGNRNVVKRFLREARLSSRLGQPSIVNVYDFGQTEDGILYIVMELLRGRTLAAELEAHRALGVARAVRIAIQLCDALDAAHKQGIIHRDLKPGNVILLDEPPGRDLIKVLDFGLAKSLDHDPISKVTRSDTLLGTPLYMSPEQIGGQPSDARSDLYSLGCMVHEMLSGASPFVGPTVDRVLANHLYELAAPLPAGTPPALAELIARLIAKHPVDRPQTAAEVRDALLADPGQPRGPAPRVLVATATAPAAGAPPITMPSSDSMVPAGARGRGWWGAVALIALIAAAGVGAAVLRAGSGPSTPASAASADAAIATDAQADASSASSEMPAQLPVDARARPAAADAAIAPARPDAGRRTVRDPGRAPVTPPRHPPPVDAGGELEFYRADAGR